VSRNIQKARAELEVGDPTGNNANRPYNLMESGRVAYALGRADVAALLSGAQWSILHDYA
jgi:hypothetical protein